MRPPELSPVAGKSRQDFNGFCFGRSDCCDSVFSKISRVIERAGISEVTRRIKSDRKSQAFAVAEHVRGGVAGFLPFIRFVLIFSVPAVDINAKAGVDDKGLAFRVDLLSLNIQPLLRIPWRLLPQISFLDNMCRNDQVASVRECEYVLTMTLGNAHLHHQRCRHE